MQVITMNEASRNHILKGLKENIRIDGRKCDEFREVKIEYGVTRNAEGSAKVTIGDTEVIVGVKMSLETPYPDTPDSGNFMVNVELLPLSNPEFESGPPSIDSIELARVTDRGVRESKAIDTKKLCIKPGEKVWGVIVDITPINDAGNLFDASAIGTLAALKDTKFPKLDKKGDTLSIDYHEKTKESLPLIKQPVGVTVWKIGESMIIDPSIEEQKIYDARLTVTSMEDSSICALQKGGDSALSLEDIDKMLTLALEKAKELRKTL
jgi:exosome complex component RRP42